MERSLGDTYLNLNPYTQFFLFGLIVTNDSAMIGKGFPQWKDGSHFKSELKMAGAQHEPMYRDVVKPTEQTGFVLFVGF